MSKIKRVLIDADGCPVVDYCISICKKYNLKCLILCDTSHVFNKEGAETMVLSKGADSVDFALVNLLKIGDIAVTQDYGLAAMCMAKKVRVINQNGMEYTDDNIEALLMARHTAKKIRNAGGRLRGSSKRTKEQDLDFVKGIEKIILEED